MVPTPIVRTLYSILNDGNDIPEHIDCIIQPCIMTIHGDIMFSNDPVKEPPPPHPPPHINMINENEEVTNAPAYQQTHTNKVQEVPQNLHHHLHLISKIKLNLTMSFLLLDGMSL